MNRTLLILTSFLIMFSAQATIQIPPIVMGTAWHRTSAEYRALCFQAYNMATIQLKLGLKKKNDKPLAVVLDVDETVLDNSPYTVMLIKKREHYSSKSWKKWVAKRSAPLIPGVKRFVTFAKKNGVELFYVSNRKADEVNDTFYNLKKHDIPVKKENMLFQTNISSKKPRREQISKKYRIALLVGDNMIDFSEKFEKLLPKNRATVSSELKDEFGKRFIIIPNVMYGDWENAIYNYSYKLSPKEKNSLLLKSIAI